MAEETIWKTGDNLNLGGTLTFTRNPFSTWVGSTAEIHIVSREDIYNPATGALVYARGATVRNAALTTFNTATYAWTYLGAALTYVGAYGWEIQVTAADGTVLTWPSTEDMPLTVIPQAA